jgi:hypothetical protein
VPAGRELVGYRAIGRHGELGVVVAAHENVLPSATIVIRGGASAGLLLLVPSERIRSVEGSYRTVEVDADFADFVPSLLADGTVQLRLESG